MHSGVVIFVVVEGRPRGGCGAINARDGGRRAAATWWESMQALPGRNACSNERGGPASVRRSACGGSANVVGEGAAGSW